uniref:SEC22 homolog A, vesicle trafficking protein n=1 Tax=Seriola dumerili TaxID=41447 RepID=A0A3B4UED8_SERDU
MSMVVFASVVRVGDGLPLSASTDYEQDKELQETKRHLKGLSKKLSQFPDRCTLKTGPYNVNFTSSLGVGYLMVCTANYPNVLAFCFLDELQKEFIVTYDPKRISSVVRPYSFIEFDTFIQKTKQRYNSPRSLSTKINLADMQTEIRLRPPYQLSPEDLRAINGFSVHTPSKYKGIAPTQMLEPVTLPGIVSCVLSVLCGGLNLLRGVHAIESILQNDDEDFNYVIAFFLGTAACLYQCYLFAYFSVWRNRQTDRLSDVSPALEMQRRQLWPVWGQSGNKKQSLQEDKKSCSTTVVLFSLNPSTNGQSVILHRSLNHLWI